MTIKTDKADLARLGRLDEQVAVLEQHLSTLNNAYRCNAATVEGAILSNRHRIKKLEELAAGKDDE